jgi:fatty-acyl-CoA synthase
VAAPAAGVPPDAAFDAVAWWSTVDGERIAVIDADRGTRHSYRMLDRDASRWCAVLQETGVSAGDRVAVLAQNRYEFIPLFYACLRSGVTLVPLNWRLSPPELARVLADCTPTVLVGEDRFRSLAEGALASSGSDGARWIDIDRDAAPRRAEPSGESPAHHARVEDAAMLLYTSGSTGAPKGVIISHRQIHWNALATTTGWQLGAEDVGPASTPFFHTGGWNVFTTPLLERGGSVVLFSAFDPSRYFALLHEHRVTVTFGVPTQLAMLREAGDWGRPLPHLRWFISGGAPCPPTLKAAVRDAGYRMREGYGLTECGPNCFATNDDTAVDKDGTVGWPVPFLQARLSDGGALVVEPGAVGELELRGPQLFSGYFNAPALTREVMSPDGWLRTGDLASRDADGVYTIRGRRKEMFISGGENVYPGEVEAALLGCHGVADACVLGVPDERWGEVGCAVVVPVAGGRLDEQQLVTELRARLAGFKVPKRVVFTHELPRLGSGKVDRAAVARLAGVAS